MGWYGTKLAMSSQIDWTGDLKHPGGFNTSETEMLVIGSLVEMDKM